MDFLHRALKWVSYNRGVAAALVVGAALAVGFASCVPKTRSLLDPAKRVTAAELQQEIARVQADYAAKEQAAELAQEDLERQYELRAKIVAILGGLGQLAATGGLSPENAVAGILQLLTLSVAAGAAYDNRRKDKVIAAGNGQKQPGG